MTGTTDPSVEIGDAHIAGIIDKCTANNPKHRYQSFAEVREAFKNHEEKKCPNCGELVNKSAKFCPNCGKHIDQTQPKAKPEICPRCKNPRNANDRFCDNCGWDFSKQGSGIADIVDSLSNKNSQNKKQRELIGYRCSHCYQTTKAYSDGKVFFCNYCGAGKNSLSPIYKN